MLRLFMANELGAALLILARLVYVLALLMMIVTLTWRGPVAFGIAGLIFLHVPGAYLRFKARHSVSVIFRKS